MLKFLNFYILTLACLANFAHTIYNGNNAEEHQFPFLVRLAIKLNTDETNSCGGSVIKPKWILTAAHCLPRNVVSVDIYFDTIKRNTAPQIVSVQRDKIFTHQFYISKSMRNDIALIQVNFDNSNNAIQYLSLPPKDVFYNVTENVIVAGWGRMGNINVNTEDLQWASMQIISTQQCIDSYGPFLVKATNNMCLQSENGASTCSGDSGGPAVRMAKNGKAELVGLISFGKNTTCQHGVPVVLTRVNKYVDWIEEKTAEKRS